MTQLARGLKEADTGAHGEPGLRNASSCGSPLGPQTVLTSGTLVSSSLLEASRISDGSAGEPPAQFADLLSPRLNTFPPKRDQDGPIHMCGR